MGMRLLIVDDDAKFRRYIRLGLEESGIACETACDVAEALAATADGTGPFDVVLLDVMMPGRWGWEFLEKLRKRGDETPVIFVTARHSVDERVKGLQLGADDYIIKPFDFTELLARIEAVARRRRPHALSLHGVEIDLDRRIVRRGARRVELSPREFALLQALAEAGGKVLPRAALLRTVWGIGFDPGTNVVEVLVARLRRKVDPDRRGVIETVAGQGYRLGIAESPAP